MKHSQLKQLIKEEIRRVLNENKFEQAKREIEQTDFNDFFIQPAMEKGSFGMGVKDKSMVISQLKKRVAEKLPTLISLFPDLVSGNTLYSLKSKLKGGQIIDGVTLGNLGTYIVDEYLIIDNDVAKNRLNNKISNLN